MYNHEFSLVSSKWIFRLEDMEPAEQQLWIDHLDRDGFTIEDPHEIFTPFMGEQAPHLNEDIGTQELRVRVWNWTDINNVQHKLVDINAWPGDNESGVIAIDGQAVINNSDQSLSWRPDTKDVFAFDDRMEFFYEIRKDLTGDDTCCWSESDTVKDDFDNFLQEKQEKML